MCEEWMGEGGWMCEGGYVKVNLYWRGKNAEIHLTSVRVTMAYAKNTGL